MGYWDAKLAMGTRPRALGKGGKLIGNNFIGGLFLTRFIQKFYF